MLKVLKVIWSRSNIYVPGLIVHLGGTALRAAAVSPQKIFFCEMYQAISYWEEKLEKRNDSKLCTYTVQLGNNLIIHFGRNQVKQETFNKVFTTEELS